MPCPESRRQRTPTLATNRSFAIFLAAALAGLLIYLAFAPDTFSRLRDGFYLGIIPFLTVAGMLVCAITMIFDGRHAEPFHEGAEEYRLNPRFVGLAAIALASLYLFYRAMLTIGFPLASVVFMAAMMFALGVRTLAPLLLAPAGMTAVVYAAFALLGFALPVWPL